MRGIHYGRAFRLRVEDGDEQLWAFYGEEFRNMPVGAEAGWSGGLYVVRDASLAATGTPKVRVAEWTLFRHTGDTTTSSEGESMNTIKKDISLGDIQAGQKIHVGFTVDVAYVGDLSAGVDIGYENANGHMFSVELSPDLLEDLTIEEVKPDASAILGGYFNEITYNRNARSGSFMTEKTDAARSAIEYAIEQGWRP